MTDGLEALANMEYPGRFIIIGESLGEQNNVVIYGVTGRSPSSQARRLSFREKLHFVEGAVYVEPTDEELLKKGNPDLLVYPALYFNPKCVVVSNGKQTEDLNTRGRDLYGMRSAVEILADVIRNWAYEPDEPNFTPRISGCVLKTNDAALSIVKRYEDGSAMRQYFEVPLSPGRGKLISTYTGVNTNPLPSFHGEPLDVSLDFQTAEEAAQEVYDALAPKDPAKDFRVGVVAAYFDAKTFSPSIKIINRHDLGGN